MDGQAKPEEVKVLLESFRDKFIEYDNEVHGLGRPHRLAQLRGPLQHQEPLATKYIVDILGNDFLTLQGSRKLRLTDLLANTLLGVNELPEVFSPLSEFVMSNLNRAIGTIEAGLWPRKGPKPLLVIRDNELRKRCSDLLESPGNYDRVIREATTILEDRMRNKCPHETLSRLIPESADQIGENLVNKLFAPDHPVLSISGEKHKRIAFHKVLLGTVAYLRHPYHHRLDPSTEWSWAWSAVGFIDRLLADIESCVVVQ